MIEALERHRPQIAALCRELGVRRLEVFGSAARGDAGPHSDIDLLYEFDSRPDCLADRFFTLQEQLEAMLGRPVDLVSARDIANPYFLQSVHRDRVMVYGA